VILHLFDACFSQYKYPGLLTKIRADRSCDIHYNDGDQEEHVRPELIRSAWDAPNNPSVVAAAAPPVASQVLPKASTVAPKPKKKRRTAAMVKRSIDPNSNWTCDWCKCPERDSKGKDRGPRGSSTLCARWDTLPTPMRSPSPSLVLCSFFVLSYVYIYIYRLPVHLPIDAASVSVVATMLLRKLI
jgi:hypothetical protein